MSRKVKYVFRIIALLGVMVFAMTSSGVFGPAMNTYAETEEEAGLTYSQYQTIKQNIYYKVAYANLWKCYEAMNTEIGKSGYDYLAAFDTEAYFKSEALEKGFVKFPYGVKQDGTVGASANNIRSCTDLIMGWKDPAFNRFFGSGDSSKGLLGLNTEAWVPKQANEYNEYTKRAEDNAKFLQDIGYEEKQEAAPATERCFYFKLTVTDDLFNYNKQWYSIDNNVYQTPDFCVALWENGNLKYISYRENAVNKGHLATDASMVATFVFDKSSTPYHPIVQRTDDDSWYIQSYLAFISLKGNATTTLTYTIRDPGNDDNDVCHNVGYAYCGKNIRSIVKKGEHISFDEFTNRFGNILLKARDKFGGDQPIFKKFEVVELSGEQMTNTFYKKSGDYTKFTKYFLKDVDLYNGGKFSKAEAYVLYHIYLRDYYRVNTTSEPACDNSVKVAWWSESGKFSEVYLCDPDENLEDKQIVTAASLGWSHTNSYPWYNWHQIAELMAAINIEEAFSGAEIEDLTNIAAELESGSGSTPPEAKSCLNSGGAKSLGWILCPILDVASDAAETIYDKMLEPALRVEPTLFTSHGENNGTYSGWEYFRNFANILFVIFLLVVIFSQLTGYGIDNYGIKKILPKLIVVAVMVNLSYFICTAMVDLSNILGNSLQALFKSLPGGPSNLGDWGASSYVLSGANTLVVTGLMAVIAAGGLWATWASGGGAMMIVGLLMGAISILLGFLFLFILLAARQVAIVILVVISPLAVVCYALPNTKNLFDKYKKLWTSLLLVYPIAGMLVGGGDYVSRLMLSSGAGDKFAMAITSMLAGIVPVFFIPTVLKGSLNMLGQLGAKISGFGKNMGAKYTGNLDKGIKSTDRYKNYQDMRARDRKLNEANRNIRRLNGRSDLTDRQRKLLAQSMNTVASERETDALRNNLINGGFDARMAGADAKADAQRVADIESMISNGRMDVDGQAVEAGAATAINSNNMNRGANSLAAFHRAALARHANATTTEERSNALAQIRAVQNMMSKTDAGRAAVMSNLSDAVARAQNASETNTSRMAAAHLMSDFGDLYKSKNRGAHSMISDLSTDGQLADIQTKIHDGVYDAYGVDKYTEETLAGADDAALDNLISAMNPLVDANGNTIRGASLTGTQLQTLQNTAYQALEKSKAGTLNIKPEVVAKLEQIRNGYVPQSATQAQSAQQQAQNTQDNILQELQDINAELRNQNRNNNGGNNP